MAPCCYVVAAVVIIAMICGTERQGRPRRLIFGDRRGENDTIQNCLLNLANSDRH